MRGPSCWIIVMRQHQGFLLAKETSNARCKPRYYQAFKRAEASYCERMLERIVKIRLQSQKWTTMAQVSKKERALVQASKFLCRKVTSRNRKIL